MKKIVIVALALVGLVACKKEHLILPSKEEPTKEMVHGIRLDLMDPTIEPGDDFFSYVNGAWLETAEIPSDRTVWGSFDELRKSTDKDALELIKKAIKNHSFAEGSDQKKVVDLYETYLDYDTRNREGIKPIQPILDKIDQLKNVQEINELIKYYLSTESLGFYQIYVEADRKDSNVNTVYVSPGALGLPDRDYYVSDDADSKDKKEKYEQHITRMLQFLSINKNEAAKQAKQIVDLETRMSRARLDRVESRDERNTYNPMSVEKLKALTPSVDWEGLFQKAGLHNLKEVVVVMPKYMKELEAIFKDTPMSVLKAYLRWTTFNNNTDYLTEEIGWANFDFYGKEMTGVQKQRPKEERALSVVNESLGEALGKIYVEEKFPPEAKEKADEMVRYVIKAFKNRINQLPWMSPRTKQQAINKLNKFTIKIGYPEHWEDYSKLHILSKKQGGTYFTNIKRVEEWEFQKNMADYGKPVDKTKWGMPPQTVNAYYNPSYNEIVFPAAILQPPFYDYKADMAVNFGGIGAVIGHEISHAFDDSGARFNAEGNLKNWWTDADLKQFNELGDQLAKQYGQLEPLPGIFVDGKFTLGENIGDLGGVNAAYDGLELYLKDKGRPELIDGFTPEQRFFISWATIWRTKMRDEAIKNQVKTDPHSPGMYRASVPLQNVDAWYEAFGIKPTDRLYLPKEKRVKIW